MYHISIATNQRIKRIKVNITNITINELLKFSCSAVDNIVEQKTVSSLHEIVKLIAI